MPFTASWLGVAFGSGRTGLANVGYRLFKNDGTDSVARTETGVVEVGGGGYGVPNVTIPDNAVGIEWDTTETPNAFAHEDLQPLRAVEICRYMLANRLELADGSVDNWIVRDDADAPVLKFSVTDKSGNAILSPASSPAKRTKGVAP